MSLLVLSKKVIKPYRYHNCARLINEMVDVLNDNTQKFGFINYSPYYGDSYDFHVNDIEFWTISEWKSYNNWIKWSTSEERQNIIDKYEKDILSEKHKILHKPISDIFLL
tara:strand:- start:27 stop:356 length:330 start_codon:yes stop_codon:yes gene_type:complete